MKLSEAQAYALIAITDEGGAILTSKIPDKTEKNIHGDPIAGLNVYKKLESMGLVFTTVEEDETGFDWTPSIYITDEGTQALNDYFKK